MASTSKANLNNSLKLFKLNILLLILILIIFSWMGVTLILEDLDSLFDIIGLGYYLTISILILNIIAVKKVKNLYQVLSSKRNFLSQIYMLLALNLHNYLRFYKTSYHLLFFFVSNYFLEYGLELLS